MLIKLLNIHQKNVSPEERSRAALSVGSGAAALGLAGLVTLVLLEVLQVFSVEQTISAYANGFLFGISGGMIGAGVSNAVSAWQRLHDPEKMRQFEIKCRDERNLAIQNAAAKMTFFSALVILYLCIIVSAFFQPTLSMVFSLVAVGLFALYFIFIGIFSRKM